MKHNIYILLLAITIGFTQCCKEKPTNSDDNNLPGLPPATQTGANTLGFLLNGEPWTPAGNNGTANLSIDFDPGFNNGIFGIAAYKASPTTISQIVIWVKDSLNFITIPKQYYIDSVSLGGVSFTDNESCERHSYDSRNYSSGILNITKLNRVAGILAGDFHCLLFNPSCGDTIKITNGRFDIKF